MNSNHSTNHIPTQLSGSQPETQASLYQRLFARRGQYQQAESSQTLREGLAEYYQVNPGLIDPASMDDSFSTDYFRCHDLTHVIFGTHTGPLDEGINDVLTMFAVDVSYPRYLIGFFKTSGAGAVAKDYSETTPLRSMLRAGTGTLQMMPRIWRMARSMHKKWPWTPPEAYLDRSLADLRAEYGIVVYRYEQLLGLQELP